MDWKRCAIHGFGPCQDMVLFGLWMFMVIHPIKNGSPNRMGASIPIISCLVGIPRTMAIRIKQTHMDWWHPNGFMKTTNGLSNGLSKMALMVYIYVHVCMYVCMHVCMYVMYVMYVSMSVCHVCIVCQYVMHACMHGWMECNYVM